MLQFKDERQIKHGKRKQLNLYLLHPCLDCSTSFVSTQLYVLHLTAASYFILKKGFGLMRVSFDHPLLSQNRFSTVTSIFASVCLCLTTSTVKRLFVGGS